MFSTNLKRSVATLGVVAGLLAAAVPAGATPVGVPAGSENDALTVKPKAKALNTNAGDDTVAGTPKATAKAKYKAKATAGQGAASDPTAQGIIMSDGRICNPRWGC